MRGYFGMGIENTKKGHNIGTLWRSAYAFGASYIFTIGNRYSHQPSDTPCAWRHIPLIQFPDLPTFQKAIPFDCMVIGIEYAKTAVELRRFAHPARAVYLLGAEDWGLSQEAMAICEKIVRIPCDYCLNVATAGSIIMYDRSQKGDRAYAKEMANANPHP